MEDGNLMDETLPTIVVCDDDGTRVKRWARAIDRVPSVSDAYTVVPWTPDEFALAFIGLKNRQRAERGNASSPDEAGFEVLSQLDRATFVVVDFDLTPMNTNDALDPSTLDTLSGSFGDQFAFLIRHYSDAAVTILVNEIFYQSTFDLTHEAFVHSSADLNVAHNDLGRPELWTGSSDGRAFRPWHWPRLLDVPKHLQAIAADLDLDQPVLAALGLGEQSIIAQFSSEQLDLFGPNPDGVTFRDAARFPSVFKGLSRDESIPASHMRSVAVASVSHWLERIVLPAQNVLIDAPHLAQRRPGLLASPEPKDWGPLTDLSNPNTAKEMFNSSQLIEAAVPLLEPWLSRPAWLWHRCPHARIRAAGVPHVFCEDVSAFHPLDDAYEYRSSVPGPFGQRFILRESRSAGFPVNYWPNGRLFADSHQ
jgi:hypothetical protein